MIRKCLKVIAVLVCILIVLLVVVRVAISPIVSRVGAPIASKQLKTDVTLDGVQLGLLRGYAGLRDIAIQQPDGFAQAPPLFSARNLSFSVIPRDLLKKQIRIEHATIESLSLYVVRNADGTLNIEQLIPEPSPKPEEPTPKKADRSSPPTITIDRASISEAVIAFSDYSVQPPIQLAFTNLHLELTNLQFDPAGAGTTTNMPGSFRMTASILQPGYTNGFLGVSAVIGVVGTNTPPVNAALRIVGFDISTLSGMLPAGVSALIGGSSVDLIADAAVAEDWLRVSTRLNTAGSTLRMGISGTPNEPIFDKSTALFNLITRPGALLAGTAAGVADAGMEAGRTVISTAGRAGGGVISGVANIGRGAARTVQSAARGDIRGIGEGVTDMTYGTVTGAVGTVAHTTRGAVEGVGKTFSAAAGRTQTENWQADTPARWATRWQEALDFTAQAPFPGSVPPPDFLPPEEEEQEQQELEAHAQEDPSPPDEP